MDLESYKIIINSSLFVLIWIVQLVIYPGFCYYSEIDMRKWHPVYTTRMTLIVMPLMISQLMIYAYSSFYFPSASTICILLLVLAIWANTFLIAIPLHQIIDKKANTLGKRKKLVQINWVRTIGWTLILMISLLEYGK